MVGPTIGEGAFGHVVYAVHKATERKVAIKVMEVTTASGNHRKAQQQQKTQMILNERRILSLPEIKSSKWTVDLWAAFMGKASSCSSSSQCLYFVMKLANGGTLSELIQRGLRSNRNEWLQFSAPYYASQLIQAVEFLHSKGILHCDLKPDNVLLDTNGNLVLADFGCAFDTSLQQPTLNPPRGTALYASPEVLRAKMPLVSDDYWSVGCILHAMCHGSSPFDRGSEALTVEAILQHCGGSDTACEKGTFESAATIDKLETAQNATVPTNLASVENSNDSTDSHADDPIQRLSKELIAVLPDDRIIAWKENALSFVSSNSDFDPDSCSKEGTKTILLPVPEWQEEVDNATLRDGSLGWFVFQQI